jgi:hypothetical protein
MTTAVNQLYHRYDDATGRYIISAVGDVENYVDLKEALARDRATFIYADTIKLTGAVSSSAHGVTLYCRRFIAGPGAIIDTSGINGAPSYPAGLPPHQGGVPGQSGNDGKPGGSGKKAGPVTIYAQQISGKLQIKATGGDGGRGEDGEDGFTGEQGPRGEILPDQEYEAEDNRPDVDERCHGKKGGTGGNGGRAGLSGKGGDGGDVLVAARTALAAGQVTVVNTGGKAGDTAKPGKRGEGGPGGSRGSHWIKACTTITNGRTHRSCTRVAELFGREGKQGDPGESFDAVPVQAGRDGEPKTPVRALAAAEFAPSFKGVFVEMLCWSVEDDYRKSGGVVDEAFAARLNFLIEICEADPAPGAEKGSVLAKAYALRRKHEIGLDFYGYSIEDAPLLSYETYADFIGESLFTQLETVERNYRSVFDVAQDADQKRKAIKDAVDDAKKTIRQLSDTRDAAIVMAQESSANVAKIQASVDQARRVLEGAKTELERAILTGSGQSCDLGNVLTAALAIYAAYQTGVGAFGKVTGAWDKIVTTLAFDDTLKKLFDDRAVFQKELKVMEGGFNGVQDAMNKIGAEVNALGPQQRNLPNLVLQKQHFDKIAAQFAGFAAAAGYREAGYAYLKAVEARNQAIVDYNAAVLRVLQLQAQVIAAKHALDALETKLTAEYDPADAMIFALLTRIYRETLSFAGAFVHAERKALAYALNTPAIAPLSELNASTLVYARMQTMGAWKAAKEKFKVRRRAQNIVIDLRDFSHEPAERPPDAPPDWKPPADAWENFKATGNLVFFLRREHPKYSRPFKRLPGLRFERVELLLEGVTAKPGAAFQDGQLYWFLRQSGQEEVYRADGTMVRFRHNSVRVDGSLALGGGAPLIEPSFIEDGRYFGLSPFSGWHLTIDEFDQFDFSNLSGAQLRFGGSYVQDA